MKKVLLLIIIGCLLLTPRLFSQNTGYMGRHFILKTDLMYPLFSDGFSGELEAIVLRRLSLTARYTNQNRIKRLSEYGSGNYYVGYQEAIGDWKVKSSDILLGFRYYLEPEQPAPKGGYMFFNYGFGKADFSGRQATGSGDFSSSNSITYYYDVSARNVPVNQYNIGFGYQSIFFRRVVFDFSISYVKSWLSVSAKYESELASLSDSYGINLIKVLGFEGGNYVQPAYGINLNLRVGVLIY